MKALTQRLFSRLQQIPPATATAIGFVLLAGLVAADCSTPFLLSFTPFYVIGIAFLGWSAGFRPAAVFAVISAVATAYQDWIVSHNTPALRWIVFVNAACRATVFCG